jgi:hypothetical protein
MGVPNRALNDCDASGFDRNTAFGRQTLDLWRRGRLGMTGQLPKVCEIGACSCGLPVIKAFNQRGIPVTCYENTANIGRLWCIENKASGATAAEDSLHINYVSL